MNDTRDRPDDSNLRPVIVCDQHRTVWYGYTDESGRSETIRLWDVRNCYYFDTDEGIGELAVSGPPLGSKIGCEIETAVVRDVATVMDASEEAAETFARQGWGERNDG